MIQSVEEKLWQWGDWSRGDMIINRGGTVIGRLIKRKQIEAGEGSDTVWDKTLLDEDMMMSIDHAIGELPPKLIRLCKCKYKAGHSNARVAQQMKIHRNTVRSWIDELHSKLERKLK